MKAASSPTLINFIVWRDESCRAHYGRETCYWGFVPTTNNKLNCCRETNPSGGKNWVGYFTGFKAGSLVGSEVSENIGSKK
jgi:hypothetical protein